MSKVLSVINVYRIPIELKNACNSNAHSLNVKRNKNRCPSEGTPISKCWAKRFAQGRPLWLTKSQPASWRKWLMKRREASERHIEHVDLQNYFCNHATDHSIFAIYSIFIPQPSASTASGNNWCLPPSSLLPFCCCYCNSLPLLLGCCWKRLPHQPSQSSSMLCSPNSEINMANYMHGI